MIARHVVASRAYEEESRSNPDFEQFMWLEGDRINYEPCFKYRLSRLRYRLISPFLPAAYTMWENRSPYRLQQKTTDI